jgi:hypothetical protein
VTARETRETGMHLVVAELHRREVFDREATRGERGIDLLTTTGHRLQVTTKRGKGRWVLGQEGGRSEAADILVLVSVGEQPADAEFYVVPVGVLYDWAEDRHRAYWARRGEVTGESGLVQIRDTDADVREFLDPYRDAWERVTGARKA